MARSVRPRRALAAEIAKAIRGGDYRAGEWLRQVDLEERFGATRFDIRAALAELALRHAVEHVPNRGFRVAIPDRQRVQDTLIVRALLEAEAAVGALPHLDAAALRLLEEKADAFDRAVEEGTPISQSASNLDFHDTLYGFCPNKTLVDIATEVRDRYRLWPLVLWPSMQALRRSAEGHRSILAAARAGDAAALAACVRAHILESDANQ